ncbi:paralemmin-3 [Conger conger]|uniref:paralemmin-3 n=1 Tax=Conger conger TaxID=82655 RepID=UPI002A5A9A35|nr:paralemmin-3 [Conger conger]
MRTTGTPVRWKMDEAEKYQQRLQAIAEKRRLQEEEDRAKREMEDQKLRDQQRKRKSLRDQWLNEGPPSSPESPGPNSPFFSSPTEEVEAQIQDKLQESQLTVEEKADLQEQQDNDKAEEVKEDGGSPEEAPPASLENGQQEPPVVGDAMSASPEDEADSGPAKMDNGLESLQAAGAQPALNTEAGPAPEEAEVIPNGIPESKEEPAADPAPEPPRQDEEANAEVPQSAPDTPAQEEEGGAENPAPLQPGKDVEDEDAGEIIRAERVIVTDDGDEPADTENVAPPDNAKEPAPAPENAASLPESSAPEPESSAPPAESSAPEPEISASPAERSAPEPEISASPAERSAPEPESSAPPAESSAPEPESSAPEPESSASPAESSAPEPESSASPAETSAPEPESSASPAENTAPAPESSASVELPVPEEPKPDPAEAPKDEEAAEAGAEAQAGAEGNVEAPASEAQADSAEPDVLASDVPVYPAGLPSAAPQPEAVGEGVKPEEKAEAPAPAVVAGQFQDIPLDGSAKPEAVQPVAGTTETPAVPAEQQTLLDPSKTAPARAEAGDTPKRKTCQCCSVM